MLSILLTLVLIVGIDGFVHKATAEQPYSMVLVGGHLQDDNAEIWNQIIDLGGGEGKARLGVVAAASEDPCCDDDSSWVYYRDLLTRYGAAEVYYIPVTVDSKANNSEPTVVAKISTLTGVFFGGGDQLRIIQSFYNSLDEQHSNLTETAAVLSIPSPVLIAIKQMLLATGGVIAGTSAGTDCQTENVMISGGASYEAWLNGTYTFWRPHELVDASLLTSYGSGGIGLFPYGLLDTHFGNRGRHGRLVRLLLDSQVLPHGTFRAFGMDENTALVITGPLSARKLTVLGERGVWLFDIAQSVTTPTAPLIPSSSSSPPHCTVATAAARATYSPLASTTSCSSIMHNNEAYNVDFISLSRFSRGDSYDLNLNKLVPASYKNPYSENSPTEPAASNDIFAEDTFEFDKISDSLLKSSYESTYGVTNSDNSIQFMVELHKQWNTSSSSGSTTSTPTLVEAQGYAGVDPDTGDYVFSFQDVRMSITTKLKTNA